MRSSSAKTKLRCVLMTGSPGVGKTTLVKKICQCLQKESLNLTGFYTEEVRQGGRRIGFDVVDILDGSSKPLARVGEDGGPKVGQYCVHVADFESVALSRLKQPQKDCILVIDEIGKMELFSKPFEKLVSDAFCSENPILATIPVLKAGARPIPLLEKLRSRPDAQIFHVTKENRDDPRVLQNILAILAGK